VKNILKLVFTCLGMAAIVWVAWHFNDLLRVASRTHIRWEHKGLNGFYDRLSIGPEGTLYVLTAETSKQHFLLEAVDASGALRWSKDGILTAPAVDAEGRLYVYGFTPPERDKVFIEALDAGGHALWTWWVPPSEPSDLTTPTIGGDGTVFFGGRRIRAFDRSGQLLWTFGEASDGFVYGRPLINADKRLYVLRTRIDSSDISGHLLILNQDGIQLSDVDVFNRYASLLPMDPGHVAAVGMDLPIGTNTYTPGLAIASDGSFAKMDQLLTRVRMIGKKHWYLVIGNRDMAVVGPDGEKICANTGNDHFDHWSLAADGTVYAGGDELISISPSCWTGWRLTFGSPVFSIALGKDGTVYVLTEDGTLRAITETFPSKGQVHSLWPTDNHDSRNTNSVLETP
jgi:outer membrane protein assembly factor BamB